MPTAQRGHAETSQSLALHSFSRDAPAERVSKPVPRPRRVVMFKNPPLSTTLRAHRAFAVNLHPSAVPASLRLCGEMQHFVQTRPPHFRSAFPDDFIDPCPEHVAGKTANSQTYVRTPMTRAPTFPNATLTTQDKTPRISPTKLGPPPTRQNSTALSHNSRRSHCFLASFCPHSFTMSIHSTLPIHPVQQKSPRHRRGRFELIANR
jgi:hypothetical protein